VQCSPIPKWLDNGIFVSVFLHMLYHSREQSDSIRAQNNGCIK
jgi:hypothetical protein